MEKRISLTIILCSILSSVMLARAGMMSITHLIGLSMIMSALVLPIVTSAYMTYPSAWEKLANNKNKLLSKVSVSWYAYIPEGEIKISMPKYLGMCYSVVAIGVLIYK